MTLEELETLEAKRKRYEEAFIYLNHTIDDCVFLDDGDARNAIAVYREALRQAAPELIRLAKIGALLRMSKEIGDDGKLPDTEAVNEACQTYREIMGMMFKN